MSKENEFIKESNELIRLSMDIPKKIELVEDKDESPTYKIKFELIDIGEYNKFDFSNENLDYMVKEFNDDDIEIVSHGLDHSVKTLEQLGKVYAVERDDSGEKPKVIVFSELFKETDAQKQAYILFKQGLLNFVSGGWKPEKFIWNDEKNNITIVNPKLKEVSSTPVPAKRDARALEILQSLNHSPKNGDEEKIIEMSKEDTIMSDENPKIPSVGGQEVSEHEARLTALENEYKAKIEAQNSLVAEMKAKLDADNRISLVSRAAELGLSEELFKDSSNEAMELALKAAKEVQVSELSKRESEHNLGGDGNGATFKDGSPEMIDLVAREFYGYVEPKAVR